MSSSFVPPLETFNNPTDRAFFSSPPSSIQYLLALFLLSILIISITFHDQSCRSIPFVRSPRRILRTRMERDDDEETREPSTKRKKREITSALRHNRSVYRAYLFPPCSSTVRWSRIYPLETVKNHFISSNVY